MNRRGKREGLTREIFAPIAASLLVLTSVAAAAGVETKPGLVVQPERVRFSRLGDGRQVLVSEVGEDGRIRDLTGEANYSVEPQGAVVVTPGGYLRPLRPGKATVTVEHGGHRSWVEVEATDEDKARPVHFANEVEPILSRHGCNAGGCHGKASGQNGFKLSLFGFDPAFDHDAMVKEGRGRRVFPAAPEQSLLLTKPTGQVPHGGGRRFDRDSEAYRVIRRWIAQGHPVGRCASADARAARGRSRPDASSTGARQQLAVLADYTDGSVRDVTRAGPVPEQRDRAGGGGRGRPGPHVRPGRRGGRDGPLHGPGRRLPRDRPAAATPDQFAADAGRANSTGQLHRRAGPGQWKKLGLRPVGAVTDEPSSSAASASTCAAGCPPPKKSGRSSPTPRPTSGPG